MTGRNRTADQRHGHSSPRTPTYRSWQNMVARCTQPSNPAFEHYKKAGVTVCPRWRLFDNFLADMGIRPAGDYTLERMKNAGIYEPGNCRWATKIEQANNRVTNIVFEYRGAAFTLAQLARHTGVDKSLLRERLCRSELPWTVEGAISTPRLTKSKAGFFL